MARKKEKEQDGPPKCIVDGCSLQPVAGTDMCVTHGLVDLAVDRARKAFNKGKMVDGFLAGAVATILDRSGPAVVPMLMTAAQRFANQPGPRARQQPSPAAPNPWHVLGLDATRATQADVKSMQRELAKLYHPDRCGAAISEAKLKETNAAATACLKQLKEQGRP